MKVFLEVVERGTFVAAADRLNLSTASTSKHVMHVEKRLGARLLNRNTRCLTLTEVGRIYFARCKAVLENLQQTEAEIGSYGSTPRGTLRVTCPSWMATRGVAEFIAAHRMRYPEVVVDLNFDDRFTDLVEMGYDVALRVTGNTPPVGLVARRLGSVPLVVTTSTAYLQRKGIPRSPQELALHDSIMIGNGNAWDFQSTDGSLQVPARVVSRFRSTIGAAHAVGTGIGLAPLPLSVVEDPSFRGVLRPILQNYPLRHPTFFAVYEGGKLTPPKIRTFVDHLIEFASEQPLWRQSSDISLWREESNRLIRAHTPASRLPARVGSNAMVDVARLTS